ncbi:hypothetical protein ACWGDX_13315 [Streptomyces sp. NPDC055025]
MPERRLALLPIDPRALPLELQQQPSEPTVVELVRSLVQAGEPLPLRIAIVPVATRASASECGGMF